MEKVNAEIEFETVPVRIPKAVMNLLRTFRSDDLQEYLTHTIVENVASVLASDCHHGEIVSYWNIVERFGLKRVFEAFDCKMPIHKDC
jgi:hypothetical protein